MHRICTEYAQNMHTYAQYAQNMHKDALYAQRCTGMHNLRYVQTHSSVNTYLPASLF